MLAINYDEKNRLPEIISNFDLTCSEKNRRIIHGHLSFNRDTGFIEIFYEKTGN